MQSGNQAVLFPNNFFPGGIFFWLGKLLLYGDIQGCRGVDRRGVVGCFGRSGEIIRNPWEWPVLQRFFKILGKGGARQAAQTEDKLSIDQLLLEAHFHEEGPRDSLITPESTTLGWQLQIFNDMLRDRMLLFYTQPNPLGGRDIVLEENLTLLPAWEVGLFDRRFFQSFYGRGPGTSPHPR